jgi:hypothetical protein
MYAWLFCLLFAVTSRGFAYAIWQFTQMCITIIPIARPQVCHSLVCTERLESDP